MVQLLKFLDSFVGDINNPDTRRNLLNSLIDKIYVYPDKLVMTFHYSDDRRELPFEETVQFIKNWQAILSMLDSYQPVNDSAKMFESLFDNMEDDPDFFREVFVYSGFKSTKNRDSCSRKGT